MQMFQLFLSGFVVKAPHVDRWSLQMLENPLLLIRKKQNQIFVMVKE